MENKPILIAYLAAWVIYLAGIYAYSIWRRIAIAITTCSHLAPSIVAMSMAYIFLIRHGATVAQFVAGSDEGMDLWSLWVGLWPLLLVATFAAGIAHVAWTIAACLKKTHRIWLPVSISGTAMCLFALVTVLFNFPDA